MVEFSIILVCQRVSVATISERIFGMNSSEWRLVVSAARFFFKSDPLVGALEPGRGDPEAET